MKTRTSAPRRRSAGAPAPGGSRGAGSGRAETPVGRPSTARRAPVPSRRGSVHVAPLTPDRWPVLERLFGPNGACGGCWCMWWRLSHREFEAGKGAGNRRALRRIVAVGEVPGLIATVGGEPAGWCALGPRAAYPRLATSRNLRPVDALQVWSVTCFFIARPFRRQGLTVELLEAAKRHARRHGARILEGYPIESGARDVPAAFAWTGFVAAFRGAGFVEVARRSPRQPILRCTLSGRQA